MVVGNGPDGNTSLLGLVREREGRDRGGGKLLGARKTASWPQPDARRGWHRRGVARGIEPTDG
jgi:hypothetical protein